LYVVDTTSMTTLAIWHGTQQESLELANAVANNCACTFGEMGQVLTVCGAHTMLIEDQRALNGLLFVRRMAERLLASEFAAKLQGAAT